MENINENTDVSEVETLFNVEQKEVLRGSSYEYLILELLGQGTFGKVSRCKNVTTKELVAVKVVIKDNISSSKGEAEMLQKLLKLNPDKNSLLKFKEHFFYRKHLCVVTEMLDRSLFDFMRSRNFAPLHVCEVRAIAQQMLVALKALKSINVVHADIKPDNIMLVNHHSQPFKVKLIDFGLATEAPNLRKKGIVQNLAYRAPEVLLRHPALDEGVDMFTLGSVLAFLFLADHLYPLKSEYEAMRMVIQLNGKPDSDFLDAAYDTNRYFNLVKEVPHRLWRLKSSEEYRRETGEDVEYHRGVASSFFSLDGLMAMQPERMIPTVYDDTSAFISLLKQMLDVDPRKRIPPSEALNHEFVTMEHLCLDDNGPYVVSAKIIMAVCCSDEGSCISAEREEEKVRSSGSSGKLVVTSVQGGLKKDEQDTSGRAAVRSGLSEARNSREETTRGTVRKGRLDVFKRLTAADTTHDVISHPEEMKSTLEPDVTELQGEPVMDLPVKLITPRDQDFKTMKPLEQKCISAEHENIRTSDSDTSRDPKPVTAASLNRTSLSGVSNGVTDHWIEGDVRASGTSEKMVAPKTRFRKQEVASAPRTVRKHKKNRRAPVENGSCEGSYSKGEEPPAHKGKTSQTVDKTESYEANYSRRGTTAVPRTERGGEMGVFNKRAYDVTSCKEKITPTPGTERKDLQEEPAMELTEKPTAGGGKPSKKRKKRNHKKKHG